MPDLGRDSESMRISVMEKEISIQEKKFAQKKIELEILRYTAQIKDRRESIAAITETITKEQTDLDAMIAAYESTARSE